MAGHTIESKENWAVCQTEMIRLQRPIEQQGTDAQTERKGDQLSCSREETLRLGQTDEMVLHKVNCSRYPKTDGIGRSLQCQ